MAIVIASFILYGTIIEPKTVIIKEIFIEDSLLSKSLGTIDVVFLADLHLGNFTKHHKSILRILHNINPDIILLGGDYVQWKKGYKNAFKFISQLHAKIGILGVLGDYDLSDSRKSCFFCHQAISPKQPLQHQNVRFLRDQWIRICLGDGALWIGGIMPHDVDGNSARDGFPTAENIKGPMILLSHNPLIFDKIDKNKDILILSGDTHGGQVPLPHWFWKLIGYRKNAKYERGFFQEGLKKMFVTSGVGTSHLPFRFLRPPEIVRLHFVDPLNHSR